MNYGYSPAPGSASGADVVINYTSYNGTANTGNQEQGNVAWSLKLHSAQNAAGAGNILLGDGSSQQVSSGNLRLNWIRNAADSGNEISPVAQTIRCNALIQSNLIFQERHPQGCLFLPQSNGSMEG